MGTKRQEDGFLIFDDSGELGLASKEKELANRDGPQAGAALRRLLASDPREKHTGCRHVDLGQSLPRVGLTVRRWKGLPRTTNGCEVRNLLFVIEFYRMKFRKPARSRARPLNEWPSCV